MVMTTSARAAAVLAVSTPTPPAALSLATAAALISTPSTWWPALSRFCAIGKPMLPSPTNAMRAMTPSPLYFSSLRLFLRRFQRQSQIKHKQAAFQQIAQQTAAEHLRKKYFNRQHRGHRGEPDHRAPSGGEPQPNRRDQIDHREEHRGGLPSDRMVLEHFIGIDADAAHARPMIEPLEHRQAGHHAQEQHQPPRPAPDAALALAL